MADVDRRLHEQMQSRYEALAPVLRHGTQLGGKRLRPALMMLSGLAVHARRNAVISGDASAGVPEEVRVMATVVEMVHTATLIHDDVLDEAESRRHVATVNARWDNQTSILLGDYLFAQSYALAATLPTTIGCRWVGQAAQAVCEGELRQVLGREWLEMDEETYLDIIRGKTAELTRVSCQLGAHFAGGDDDDIAYLARFGNDIGIAFQIADDFLDLWGDDEHVGKTLGTDIKQGKMTLPLLRLLQSEDPQVATEARRALRDDPEQRLSAIMPLLRNSDAIRYTREKAEWFRQSAVASLEHLPQSPARESLRRMADFAIERRF
ncbi:MAG: polyprenyl synthetase family protein [Planctomycetota bacterium]